jgi:hypothetical protein
MLLVLVLLLVLELQSFTSGGSRAQEISFQEFQNQLLARGLVGRLEVVNGNMVRCVVRHKQCYVCCVRNIMQQLHA